MKTYIKKFLVGGCLLLSLAHPAMGQQAVDLSERMSQLLSAEPKDPQAIAELLWESTQSATQLAALLNSVCDIKYYELSRPIVQAILSHAHDLRLLLFKNAYLNHKVKMGNVKNLTSIGISPDGRCLVGMSNTVTNNLLCWDRVSKELLRLGGNEGVGDYIFSPDGTHVVYKSKMGGANREVVRHSLGANTDVKLDVKLESFDVVKFLNGRFIRINFSQQRPAEIYDFEHPDKPVATIEGKNTIYASVSPNSRFLVFNQEFDKTANLICVQTKVSVQLPDYGEGHVFSRSGNHLVVGINSPKLTIWDTSTDHARRQRAYQLINDPKYISVEALSDEYMLVMFLDKLGKKQLQIIDSASGDKLYSCRANAYKVSSRGGHIAIHSDNAISIYDMQKRAVSKTLNFTCPFYLFTISPKGSYVAVQEKDGASDIAVYGVESGNCLMRIPNANIKFSFYEDDERYLIGYAYYGQANAKNSASFWNVQTGQHVGEWNSGKLSNIQFKNSCPCTFLSYNADMRTFSIVDMATIVRLDQTISDLDSIETALELAILSNKIALTQYTDSLMDRVAVYGSQHTESLLSSLDRLNEYDACIASIKARVDDSATSTSTSSVGPAKKRHKKIDEQQEAMLAIDRSTLVMNDQKLQSLITEAQTLSVTIGYFDDQLKEYNALPLAEQQAISKRISSVRVFNYYLMFKDDLLGLVAGKKAALAQKKASWHYAAMKLCLTWLPRLSQSLMISKKAAPVIECFNKHATPGTIDNPIQQVADGLRRYMEAVRYGNFREVMEAKVVLEKQYNSVVGCPFDIRDLLPYLDICQFNSLFYQAQSEFEKLYNEIERKPCDVVQMKQELEKNRTQINAIVTNKKCKQFNKWSLRQVTMLEEILWAEKNDKLQELDVECRACLQFVPILYGFFMQALNNDIMSTSLFWAVPRANWPTFFDEYFKESTSDYISRTVKDCRIIELVPVFGQKLKGFMNRPEQEVLKDLAALYRSHKIAMNQALFDKQLFMCGIFEAFGNRNINQLGSILDRYPKANNMYVEALSLDTIMHVLTRQSVKKPECYPMIELLCKRLKDANLANTSKKRPVDVAQEAGDEQLASLMKKSLPEIPRLKVLAQRAFVVGYYNKRIMRDSIEKYFKDKKSCVPQVVVDKLEAYFLAILTNNYDEIMQAKDALAKEYSSALAEPLDMKKLLPRLNVNQFNVPFYQAQQDYEELCQRMKGLAYTHEQVQYEFKEQQAMIESIVKNSLFKNFNAWSHRYVVMLENMLKQEASQLFDDQMRIVLRFVPRLKLCVDQVMSSYNCACVSSLVVLRSSCPQFFEDYFKESAAAYINRTIKNARVVGIVSAISHKLKECVDEPVQEASKNLIVLYKSNRCAMCPDLINKQLFLCGVCKAFSDRRVDRLTQIFGDIPTMPNYLIDLSSGDTIVHLLTHQAVKKPECYPMIELLCKRLKDVNMPNKAGKTPIDIAREGGDEQLAALIK